MNCPRCDSKNVYVSHSYSTGNDGSCTQRRVCSDCSAVITTTTVIVNVNPKRGEGAYSLAKKKARSSE